MLSSCHFFGGPERQAGWTDAMFNQAKADCNRLWQGRTLSKQTLASVCECVTSGFAAHFSTRDLAHPRMGQQSEAAQIALECVKTNGVDLTRLQTSQAKNPN